MILSLSAVFITAALGLTALDFPKCLFRARAYKSIDDLASDLGAYVNSGDTEQINRMLIGRKEYVKLIHPYLPEGSSVAGDDFFNMFIEKQRAAAIKKTVDAYRGRINAVVETGAAADTITTDEFVLLKKISVTFEHVGDNYQSEKYTNNQLLGAVIEQNGKYRLLNIFYD